MPVHLHSGNSASLLQTRLLLASLPAALVIARDRGSLLLHTPAAEAPGWLAMDWLDFARQGSEQPTLAIFIGIVSMVPLLSTALIAMGLWNQLFAKLRKRPADPCWLVAGWLFTLLAPLHTPLGALFIAGSLGLVLGALVFGGSGRYLVSPALLAALFLQISFPAALPDSAASLAVNLPLAIACGLGALWLAIIDVASWRTLLAGILGALLCGLLLDQQAIETAIGWSWPNHLLVGHAAFVLAFILTDPGCAPHTPAGRWLLGLSYGVLLVLTRTLDPAHPESALLAALLATLFMPLADHLSVRHWRKRIGVENPV